MNMHVFGTFKVQFSYPDKTTKEVNGRKTTEHRVTVCKIFDLASDTLLGESRVVRHFKDVPNQRKARKYALQRAMEAAMLTKEMRTEIYKGLDDMRALRTR